MIKSLLLAIVMVAAGMFVPAAADDIPPRPGDSRVLLRYFNSDCTMVGTERWIEDVRTTWEWSGTEWVAVTEKTVYPRTFEPFTYKAQVGFHCIERGETPRNSRYSWLIYNFSCESRVAWYTLEKYRWAWHNVDGIWKIKPPRLMDTDTFKATFKPEVCD